MAAHVCLGEQLGGFHQHTLVVCCAVGERCAHHLVRGALFVTNKARITDGLPDRPERVTSPISVPGQPVIGPTPGTVLTVDPLSQQRIALQRTHQSVFRFLTPYDRIPAQAQQRRIFHRSLRCREQLTEVRHLCIVACYGSLRFPSSDPTIRFFICPSAAPTDPIAQGGRRSRITVDAIWHSGRKSQRRQSAILRASIGHSSSSMLRGSRHERMPTFTPAA